MSSWDSHCKLLKYNITEFLGRDFIYLKYYILMDLYQ